MSYGQDGTPSNHNSLNSIQAHLVARSVVQFRGPPGRAAILAHVQRCLRSTGQDSTMAKLSPDQWKVSFLHGGSAVINPKALETSDPVGERKRDANFWCAVVLRTPLTTFAQGERIKLRVNCCGGVDF